MNYENLFQVSSISVWLHHKSKFHLRKWSVYLKITFKNSPVTFAWEGGNRFVSLSSKSELQKTFVQRKEYLEYGSDICRRKFGTL